MTGRLLMNWSMASGLCEHFSFHDEEKRTCLHMSTGELSHLNEILRNDRQIKRDSKKVRKELTVKWLSLNSIDKTEKKDFKPISIQR